MSKQTDFDRGNATLTLVVSLAVMSVLLSGLSSLTVQLVGETRAQIAADASALAGVIGGEPSAERLALKNGAVLCEFTNDSIVSVRVCIGSMSARAFAREQQVDEMPTLKP
ncbi:MAG: pilus assembly protein TadG-related protein [Ilumatobacteraceae bacterium]